MFSQLYVLVSLVVLLAGQAAASPLPIMHSLAQRNPQPLDTIPAYVKRADGPPVNNVPEEQPTQSLDGVITVISRSDGLNVNNVPAEAATRSLNGIITLY
jgi:hypothetical protein